MRLFHSIGRIADEINSIGAKGLVVILITVSVVVFGIFFMPEISPLMRKAARFLQTVLFIPLASAFCIGAFMFIAPYIGGGDVEDENYFIYGWFLGAVGLIQFAVYYGVIEAKSYVYKYPRQGFFFNTGYPNIDMLLNVLLVIGMIVAFFGIPVLCTRYVENRELKPKFYAVVFGTFIAYCMINITDIYKVVTGWLFKKG